MKTLESLAQTVEDVNIPRERIGKYRVLTKFQKDEKVILVIKIGLRGDIYKK